MNPQLTNRKPQTERPTYEVRIAGELLGHVEPYHQSEWHAVLKIEQAFAKLRQD